jgi:hypothetical protein
VPVPERLAAVLAEPPKASSPVPISVHQIPERQLESNHPVETTAHSVRQFLPIDQRAQLVDVREKSGDDQFAMNPAYGVFGPVLSRTEAQHEGMVQDPLPSDRLAGQEGAGGLGHPTILSGDPGGQSH